MLFSTAADNSASDNSGDESQEKMRELWGQVNQEQGASPSMNFVTQVVKQNSITEWSGNPNIVKCKSCDKQFDSGWERNRHSAKCRASSAKWLRVRAAGKYLCEICNVKIEGRHQIKSHIFERHCEMEVQAKYGRSIESFVGVYEMARLR